MSDTTSPFANPDKAAHEVVLELIRAGSIQTTAYASKTFTEMLDHYHSEKTRIQQKNKEQ